MKLIIAANRLPVKIILENGAYNVIHSPGGLSTGLDSLETKVEKHWVGWPGMHLDHCNEKDAIDSRLSEQNFHPVYLSPEQIENFYEGYSNSVLWPLCHYFPNNMRYENHYWQAYKEVNALFCDAILKIIEPGDIVWVHDYQLMLLPQMIRDNIADASIGYFHHIPFPSYELFRALPERAEILNGLLGADLIAFHTHNYMRHFISGVYRVLKRDCMLDEIQMDRRIVNVDAFPMGINYEKYHEALLNPDIKANAEELKANFGDSKLILSVDRLDYTKGIMIRLRSFEEFLENYPQYIGKVSLAMVVAPSRDNVEIYADLKNEIDMKVGAINGKYSSMEWTPVYYFYRPFNFEELAAFYHIADIALITPIRDGMNLVAKEYIAVKRNDPGVLILSEMAGAAYELSDAILVNPTDIREIGCAILQALEMPVEEQKETIASMQEIISVQTVKQWAKDFIEELYCVKLKNHDLHEKIVEKKNFDKIKQAYDKARNRLIILDYDGTLAPFKKQPMQAYPTPQLLAILQKMAIAPNNHVVISSGRDKKTLELWLGHLPIGIAAEHGAFYKENGTWHQNIQKVEWDDEIPEIIKQTVRKTPHSRMEVKDTALVWHYRNVDVWLAELRVTQLINSLLNPCARHNLQIMKGNKIVEVKGGDISKGSEANRLIENSTYDFIMAIGDDTTDEEMFMALPKDSITIKVGQSSNAAMYNLPAQEQTLIFIEKLLN